MQGRTDFPAPRSSSSQGWPFPIAGDAASGDDVPSTSPPQSPEGQRREEPPPSYSSKSMLAVGERAELRLKKETLSGAVGFVGETKFASGVFVGIILDSAHGKNDGSVDGVRYFQCEPLHGLFVRPEAVWPATAEPFGDAPVPQTLAPPGSPARLVTPAIVSGPSAAAALLEQPTPVLSHSSGPSSYGPRVASDEALQPNINNAAACFPRLGSRVSFRFKGDVVIGTVRFVGEVPAAHPPSTPAAHPTGTLVGVELDIPGGKNDGAVAGVQLFRCKPLHGIFVRPSAIIAEAEQSAESVSSGIAQQRSPPAPSGPLALLAKPSLLDAKARMSLVNLGRSITAKRNSMKQEEGEVVAAATVTPRQVTARAAPQLLAVHAEVLAPSSSSSTSTAASEAPASKPIHLSGAPQLSVEESLRAQLADAEAHHRAVLVVEAMALNAARAEAASAACAARDEEARGNEARAAEARAHAAASAATKAAKAEVAQAETRMAEVIAAKSTEAAAAQRAAAEEVAAARSAVDSMRADLERARDEAAAMVEEEQRRRGTAERLMRAESDALRLERDRLQEELSVARAARATEPLPTTPLAGGKINCRWDPAAVREIRRALRYKTGDVQEVLERCEGSLDAEAVGEISRALCYNSDDLKEALAHFRGHLDAEAVREISRALHYRPQDIKDVLGVLSCRLDAAEVREMRRSAHFSGGEVKRRLMAAR